MSSLIYLAVGLFVVGIVIKLLRLLAKKRVRASDNGGDYPYKRKDYLFTQGERAFYEALRSAVGTDLLIFAKVRLEDLVWIPGGVMNRMNWTNKVRQKHVDFVLCNPAKVSPLLAIELDDSSHDADIRKQRDGEKDRVLAAAGLPLIRYRAKASYSPTELASLIGQKLSADRR